MKVDLYTKVVLTGIFVCLSLLLLRNIQFEKTAVAQDNDVDSPLHVIVTGCTNGVNGPPGAIPIAVTGCFNGVNGLSMPLPVNISDANGRATPLPVNIRGTSGFVPVEIRGPRQIPVTVQNWPRG